MLAQPALPKWVSHLMVMLTLLPIAAAVVATAPVTDAETPIWTHFIFVQPEYMPFPTMSDGTRRAIWTLLRVSVMILL